MKRQQGFTLIELLVVVAIIGILAGISITTFNEQRDKGFLATARTTLRNAITAYNAAAADDNGVAAFSTTVAAPGPLSSTAPGNPATLLPSMVLARNQRLLVSYDPACTDASCQNLYMESCHDAGTGYYSFTRMGSGEEFTLGPISMPGC